MRSVQERDAPKCKETLEEAGIKIVLAPPHANFKHFNFLVIKKTFAFLTLL
jgi:hypothetical protein